MVHDIKVVFGKRVRELRKKQGYSQEAFAAHCHVDRSHMGAIERGEYATSIETALAIAKGLGITMSTLFRDFERLVKRPRR